MIVLALLAAGCAAMEPAPEMAPARLPAAQAPDCRPEAAEVRRLNAQLVAEIAERQRAARAAARREETLKKQLDALKAIERGILDREERTQSQAR